MQAVAIIVRADALADARPVKDRVLEVVGPGDLGDLAQGGFTLLGRGGADRADLLHVAGDVVVADDALQPFEGFGEQTALVAGLVRHFHGSGARQHVGGGEARIAG